MTELYERDQDEAAAGAVVLAEIAGLREELAPGSLRGPGLDDSFDHLGLGSLELNELVLRLEKRFGVALPTELLAWADTPQDLVTALGQSPGRQPLPARTPLPVVTPDDDDGSPAAGATLPEVLDWHCHRHPDRVHIRLLDEPGSDITYGELRDRATAVAVGLMHRGVMPGDSIALVLPTGRSYFETFFGVLLAGAVPVPIYPPARRSQLAEHLRRQEGILHNCQAVLLVTVPEARSIGRLLRAQVPSLRGVVIAEDLPASGSLPALGRAASDVALLQYTSGSTGDPKGVVLTHANLLANIRALADNAEATPRDVFVSWLPLYHDMGLIGAWLTSLTVGMRLAVMSPVTFLRRPAAWLWAIDREGGTVSGGPNFAYARCTAKIEESELEGLDLSSWRLAFNGAEPVSADTLDGFGERFERYGFRRQALMPVYGLAEASVGLTFPPPGRGPVIDHVDRDRFVRSGVAESAAGKDGLRFVACGSPLVGHDVRVVDAAGVELPDRHQGRIRFQGPSATSGYLRNPEATRALFSGDWLETGDLGYFADGDLFITGRVKDLIVKSGRNLHPSEIEEAVGAVEGVRAGCVAAFADLDPSGLERLIVVAETKAAEAARAELREAVVAACVELVDVAPDEVVLVGPGSVPKTSSGKIRRGSTRELYQRGGYERPSAGHRWQLVRIGARAMTAQARGLGRRALDILWYAYARTVVAVVGALLVAALALVPVTSWRRRLARVTSRLLARLLRISLVVQNPDRLPVETAVLVANHSSLIDSAVLAAVLPNHVTFVAGRDIAAERILGFAMRRLGAQLVERIEPRHGMSDIDVLVGCAEAGETLVMFPEGHLDPAPGLTAFHLGAFAVAARAGVPVIPIAITGTARILVPYTRRLRPGTATVAIGEPIRPTGDDWEATVALRSRARDAMAATLMQPGAAGQPPRPRSTFIAS